MIQVKRYKVFDVKTGDFIVEGTARECAAVVGMTPSGFRQAHVVSAGNGHKRLLIIEQNQDEAPEELVDNSEMRDAAKEWDAFCEPIRKKYGIPVYKAPAKEGGK